MMKRAVCLLLCLLLCGFQPVRAEEVKTGTCGENLTWTLDADGLLTISGSGPMKDPGSYGSFWAGEKVTGVVIGEGVTSIGENAFMRLKELESVVIPESMTRIGPNAFMDCESLRAVVIPGGVSEIERMTFQGCRGLRSVTLSEGLKVIRSNAFRDCVCLTSIVLPEGLERIELYAFANCSNLQEINMPDSVTRLENGAFDGCGSLKNLRAMEQTVKERMAALERDRGLASFTLICAAGVTGQAAELLSGDPGEEQREILEDLAGCDFTLPKRIILIEVSGELTDRLREELGVNESGEIPAALAESENRTAGEACLSVSGMLARKEESPWTTDFASYHQWLALAEYEGFTVIGGAYESRSNPGRDAVSGAVFFASADGLSARLEAAGAVQRVYEGDRAQALVFTEGNWVSRSGASYSVNLMSNVYSSAVRLRTLFPRLLRDGIVSKEVLVDTLYDYLRKAGGYDAETMLLIASEFIPAVMGGNTPAKDFLEEHDALKPGSLPADDGWLKYEENGTALKPDAKVRIIVRAGEDCWEDLMLEAALPAGYLPGEGEEADYMIYLSTTWPEEPSVTGQGAVMYYPDTRVTIHDAVTGEMLLDGGSVRHTLFGTIYTSRRETWLEPSRSQIRTKIVNMLPDQ